MNKNKQFKVKWENNFTVLFLAVSLFFVSRSHISYSSPDSKGIIPIEQIIGQKKITVSLKSKSLRFIVNEIAKQGGVAVVFKDNGEIDALNNLSFEAKDVTVQEALNRLFKETAFTFNTVQGVINIVKRSAPQTTQQGGKAKITIKGRVTDGDSKTPLPGTMVLIKGTNYGAITNNKGEYLITFPAVKNGILSFSYVGYLPKEQPIGEQTVVDVTLKRDLMSIDKVVVIGYGERKKRELISSVSSVNAEDIKEMPAASLETLLQGRMAGVDINNISGAPGGGGSIVAIRGYNSLFENNSNSDGRQYSEPLYVIDGVPAYSFTSPVTGTNMLAEIDPANIESVEVLKDAASSAIYGSRAGNGVILITTKKGKAGAAKFSANVSYSTSQLPETPVVTGGNMERQYRMKGLINMKEVMLATDGSYRFPTSYKDFYDNNLFGLMGRYDYFWKQSIDGLGDPVSALQDSLNPYYNQSTDWWKYAFRMGKVLNANISASGGTEKVNYMIGAGYYNERGIMPGSDFGRINLISNISVNPLPKLRMDVRNYIAYTDRSRGAASEGLNTGRKIESMTVDPRDMSSLGIAEAVNREAFLAAINRDIDDNKSFRLRSSLNIDYTILKGLTLNVSGSVDFAIATRNAFKPDMGLALGNSSAFELGRNMSIQNENLLRYQFVVKEDHKFELLAGLSVNSEVAWWNGGSARKGSSDFIHYIDKNHPDYIIEPGTGNIITLKKVQSSREDKAMASFFGRVAYNYRGKYLTEVTYRSDGSSTFGANVRWATFPSVAVGWAFSEEKFMQSFEWIDFAKVRVSWGQSGQVFNSAYLAHGLLSLDGTFNGVQGLISNKDGGMYNPNLSWEKSDQIDIGLDMDMFGGKVKVKLDYYDKITSGMLWQSRMPATLYYHKFQWQNAMSVKNEGIELEAEFDIIRDKKDFSYRMKFNCSKNWNKLIKTETGRDVFPYVINRPLGGIYMYQDDGYYNTKEELGIYYKPDGTPIPITYSNSSSALYNVGMKRLIDIDGNGTITSSDRIYMGSALPKLSGGWIHELMWKGFDLNVLFTYSIGRKMYSTDNFSKLNGSDAMKPIYGDLRDMSFWEKPGDNAQFPEIGVYSPGANQFNGAVASNLETVSYVKLKQLTIGYNLPKSWTKKIGVSMVRVFGTGENIFKIHNYSGLDPEAVNVFTGIDANDTYPLARKYTIGLTITL